MAFNANTSGKQIIEYTPDDTYSALLLALEKSDHFTVKEANQTARTIAVKAGASWKSWGENLLVTVSPAINGMTELSITSSSVYGVVDWGKNQDNLKEIMNLLSGVLLSNYNKVAAPSNSVALENDIPAQIKKIADLRDANILTEDEFQQKKNELLSKM